MMAEDAVKEQIYTIPLRSIKEIPRYRRADKAMTLIRNYLTKTHEGRIQAGKVAHDH